MSSRVWYTANPQYGLRERFFTPTESLLKDSIGLRDIWDRALF